MGDMERAIATMAARIEELTNQVNAMRMGETSRAPPRVPNDDDRGLKLEVGEFDGMSPDPEIYIEWEKSMERFFEYKDTPVSKKYKLAKLKLIKNAATWFEGVQRQRVREERDKIDSWDKLKKHLRRKYVPSHYKQQLYVRLSSCRQARRSVTEYAAEFEKLTLDCDIIEPEDAKIGRFVAGLEVDLKEKLEIIRPPTYEEASRMAITYEQHAKGRKKATTYGSESLGIFETVKQWQGHEASRQETAKNKALIPHQDKVEDKYGDSRKPFKEITCFKCGGKGHTKKDCPNERPFTQGEWRDIKSTPDKKTLVILGDDQTEKLVRIDDDGRVLSCDSDYNSSSGEERDVCMPEQEEDTRALVLRRALQLKQQPEGDEQRENIFQTKCKVQGELCDLIVDGGSETNVVAKELVDRLGLTTTKHKKPYKLGWLDNATSAFVKRQCLVNFKIGSYDDELLMDVVNMDTCDILLGRPWQSDRHSKHDGYKNTYTIRHEGKKKVLVPLPPAKSVPPRRSKDSFFIAKGGVEVEEECLKKAANIAKEVQVHNRDYQEGELVFVNIKGAKPGRGAKRFKDKHEEFDSGPYEVLEKRNDNWYCVRLSNSPKISAMFRKEDIYPFVDSNHGNSRANSFEEGECCTMLSSVQASSLGPYVELASKVLRSKGLIDQKEI